MSVTFPETDTWLSHLPWVGPRPTVYGPADGIFFGSLGGTGDASMGTVTLTGLLSAARKEDWIYVLGGYASRGTGVVTTGIMYTFTTGPKIVTQGASLDLQRFDSTGNVLGFTGPGVAGVPQASQPFLGTPLFGDKKVSGDYELYRVFLETNTNTASYHASIWGFLIRYQSFFRNLPASVA